MTFKDPQSWREKLLPRWRGVEWTPRRWLLLAFGLAAFVDSFLVPIPRDVDPGRAGDGMLFLILGFRAASRSKLPLSVVVAGGCLTALAIALNHGVRETPRFLWAILGILLIAFVMFWGRRRKENHAESENV
jgi:LPXTG-motif cell wall-anchored protein